MPKNIRLYNTASSNIEEFKPIKAGEVGIYSCGPTVYHYAHIGNLRGFVFADILRRVFVSAGYKVNHIINITDVGHLVGDGDEGQDKLEKGAEREGKNVWEIAKMYTDAFLSDLESLNIPPKEYTFPRATDHIVEQIGLISALETAGYTYTISDGVYFDTSKYKKYADFAHLDVEGLKEGARVEKNKEKRNTTDFALWKFSPKTEDKDKKRQMEWDSPWGVGFPGWHIECSAMAMKYLGEHFDIHTGGIDLIPVHHTNEIAQSESATGKTYVNYWMHVNFLNENTGKMSKSDNDFLTLTTLIEKGYNPLSYRYFLLMTHYRKEINFSFDALDAATVAYNKLWSWCSLHITTFGSINNEYKENFLNAMYDDVSTPTAITNIWNLIKDESVSNEDKYQTIIFMNSILGLDLHLAKNEPVIITDDVQKLLDARNIARNEKKWDESDRLREEIEKLGFLVKDGKDGQEISERSI